MIIASVVACKCYDIDMYAQVQLQCVAVAFWFTFIQLINHNCSTFSHAHPISFEEFIPNSIKCHIGSSRGVDQYIVFLWGEMPLFYFMFLALACDVQTSWKDHYYIFRELTCCAQRMPGTY